MPDLNFELHRKQTKGSKLSVRVSSDALANWLAESASEIDTDTLDEMWEEATDREWDLETETEIESAQVVRNGNPY